MKPKETNNITRTLEVGMVKYMIKAHQFGEPNSAEYSDEFSKKFQFQVRYQKPTNKMVKIQRESARKRRTERERQREICEFKIQMSLLKSTTVLTSFPGFRFSVYKIFRMIMEVSLRLC